MTISFEKNWHYNLLGIYNLNSEGSFSNLISFIKKNHNLIDGDIIEAGVYRGHSLISIGLLLKELGSKKIIYGFDTFSGFPPVYHEKDKLKEFEILYQEGLISKDHFYSVKLNQEIIERFRKKTFGESTKNISSSGEFENTSLNSIEEKIDYLGLDNIRLIKGKFSETMNDKIGIKKIMAAIIDCDLYESYLDSLNFIWPRLAQGGFIHLDEYYSLKFPGARRATHEFIEGKKEAILKNKNSSHDFERWYLRKRSKI